jgi:chaperonin GroES
LTTPYSKRISLRSYARRQKNNRRPYSSPRRMGLLHDIDEDIRSREPWIRQNKARHINLAMLVRQGKTFPWPNASNVKFPLLATAAMQFSARAYPALVPSDGPLVKTRISQANAAGRVVGCRRAHLTTTCPSRSWSVCPTGKRTWTSC